MTHVGVVAAAAAWSCYSLDRIRPVAVVAD